MKGRGVAFARRFPCPVIYVPGNHAYYAGVGEWVEGFKPDITIEVGQ